MGRLKTQGESVKVTVPVSTVVVGGNVYRFQGFTGMAFSSLTTDATDTGEVVLDLSLSEFETSQINTADAFAKGDIVYFEDATSLFRAVAEGGVVPAGTRRFGRVTVAKDASNVVHVKRTHLE